MAPTGQDWKRLGSFVARKRFSMGYRDYKEFADALGVSDRTISRLEQGTPVSRNTLLAVEAFVGWVPQMMDRVLAGGTPPEFEAAGTSGAPTSSSAPDLRDEAERKLWAIAELSEEDRLTYINLHRARNAAQLERRRKG